MTYDFGLRFRENGKVKNGTKEEQYYGLLAQNIICKKFSQPLTDGSRGCDNGKDLVINNKVVDIKTMLRQVPCQPKFYTANLLDSQRKYHTDYYLFCSFNTTSNTLEICGLLRKDDIEKYGRYYATGEVSHNNRGKEIPTYEPRWEIDYKHMIQINTLDDIVKNIF